MDEAVRTENLKKTYSSGENAVHALRGATMSIARGESVAIVGSSGSGKSTLLHLTRFCDRIIRIEDGGVAS